MLDRPALKSQAKLRMKEHKPSVYLVTIVFLVIITVLSFLVEKLSGADAVVARLQQWFLQGDYPSQQDLAQLFPDVGFFASLLIFVIGLVRSVIEVGYQRFCLRTWRGQEAGYGDLFDEFAHFLKVIWLTILLGIFIFLWSLLFIIPGIIAAYRYSFAYYILIDNPEMSAIECIRESKRLTKGYKNQLFVLDLSFLGWAIIGGIIEGAFAALIRVSLPLFSIWLSPYMGITKAGFYNTRLEMDGIYHTEPVSAEDDNPDWEL